MSRPGAVSEAWPTWPWPPTLGQRPGGEIWSFTLVGNVNFHRNKHQISGSIDVQ